MSNTEIIPGMTEVMDYIKKQDEEIKKLKATCMGMCKQLEDATKHEIEDPTKFYRGINAVEELKKENEELKTSIQTTTSYWTDKNELLQEEINKLKEEIEELKEEVEERTTYSVLPEEGKFMEENKKLKEEAEKIEKAVREVGDCDTINACLPIWYGEEKEETFKYQSDMEKQCHNDDIDKKQQVIDELKEEKDGYFQAWLYYWSGGKQGKEHMIPMSEIEDGKYQKILEEEEEEERKAEERNNMKEFLERHNITENDLEQFVKESADYDLPK